MSEDGLSASASSAGSMAGAVPDVATVADKPRRSAKRKNGQHTNGHGAAKKQKAAPRNAAGLEADNVVLLRRDPDKVPLGVRGLLLDLAACRQARKWLGNPVGDPPDLVFFWREEKGKDGSSPILRPAQAFSGYGGCPIPLFVLRQPGDVLGTNQDEYRVAWAGEGFWHNRPQRVPAKALCEVDLPRKMFATAVLPSERALVAKIIAIQTRDKREPNIIIRLPSPGLVCELGLWSYAFSYSDDKPGDSNNPARRLYAEPEGDRVVIRNAIGGEPIPIHPISLSRLGLFADYLLAWDPDGRAFITFCHGPLSFCASIWPDQTTLCLVGAPEHGKTTAVLLLMQSASRMGSPKFRLAGEGGTAASLDDIARRYRDCFVVLDDGDGSQEATRTIIRAISAKHEGGQIRRRMNRKMSAADGAYLECGLAITTNTLHGIDKSRQRRMALILFDKPPVNGSNLPDLARQLQGNALPAEDFNDFEGCFDAGVPAGREAMESALAYIVLRLQAATDKALGAGAIPEQAEHQARQQFAVQIEHRSRLTISLLLAALRRKCPGQRFLKSVAEAFAVTWINAVLFDRAAGFAHPLEFDTPINALGPMTSRLRRIIIDHAVRAVGILNGHISVDADAIVEQFPRDLQRVLAGGRWGAVAHDGGLPKIKGVPPEAMGWTRDLDAGKALRSDPRRPPPRPGAEAEEIYRGPPRTLCYQKGNELWIELSLFSTAMAELRDSEIDYEQRDMVLPRLRDAGILIRGDAKHLTPKRRIKGERRRFIIVRADKIWPAEVKPTWEASPPSGHVINLPFGRPAGEPSAEPAATAAPEPEAEPCELPIVDQPEQTAATTAPTVAATPAARTGKQIAIFDQAGMCCISAGKIIEQDHQPDTRPDTSSSLERVLSWGDGQQDQVYLMKPWTQAAGFPERWPTGSMRNGKPETSPYLPFDGVTHPFAALSDNCPWQLHHPGRVNVLMFASHKMRSTNNRTDVWLPGYDDTALADAQNARQLAYMLLFLRQATESNKREGFTPRERPGGFVMRMWEMMADDPGVIDTAPKFAPCDFPEPARLVSPGAAADIFWTRQLTKTEINTSTSAYALGLDKKSAYLGFFGGVRCGYGDLRYVCDDPVFDKKTAGWWLIRYHAPPSWPATLPAPGWPLAPGEFGWVVTETVAFLQEIGAEIEISEAWLWSHATRALERLQARLSRARSWLMERRDDSSLPEDARIGAGLALEYLKTGYAHFTGWMSRIEDQSVDKPLWRYRPHIRAAILATNAANMLRDAARGAGILHFPDGTFCMEPRVPIVIRTDELWYLTQDDNPAVLASSLGLKFGDSLGSYGCKKPSPLKAGSIVGALSAVPEQTMPAGWHQVRRLPLRPLRRALQVK